MTTTATFDPLDHAFVASPYEAYATLRDDDPVHWSELLCGWVVTRYDDVSALLREPSMSSDIRRASPSAVVDLELEGLAEHGHGSRTIVHLDDPDHARVRKMLAAPFRVREIQRLASLVDERVATTVDRLAARGSGPLRFDMVADLAYPLPVEIFSAWLGMPAEAGPQFREWTSWVARSRDPMSTAERDELFASLAAMWLYLAEQVAERRRERRDDLLSHIVHVEHEGQPMADDELLSQLITLYMAGHEPTATVVANGVLALLRHPDQLERLVAEPALIAGAVHEILRFDGPNQFIRRVTTTPLTIAGTEVAPGSLLYLGLAAANRDPRRWGADAERLVVDRADAADHVQFGAGMHACLGAHFGRLQAERMLGTFLARLGDLQLAGEPTWSTRMFIRGLASLPVEATVRA